MGDPALCRLYLGLSKLDAETADDLRKQMPASRLKAFAHVLDFYGGMFQIQKGVAIVPGGEKAWQAWTELASGKSPKEGSVFFERMLTRDDGWAAATTMRLPVSADPLAITCWSRNGCIASTRRCADASRALVPPVRFSAPAPI